MVLSVFIFIVHPAPSRGRKPTTQDPRVDTSARIHTRDPMWVTEVQTMTKDEFEDWYAVEDARDPNTTDEWYVVGEVSHGWPLEHLMEFLGLCGCGTGKPKEAIARTLWALWESHKAANAGVKFPARAPWVIAGDFYNEPMVELILMIFHHKGIVTHGGSVTGARLEPAGVEWAERVFSRWILSKEW